MAGVMGKIWNFLGVEQEEDEEEEELENYEQD